MKYITKTIRGKKVDFSMEDLSFIVWSGKIKPEEKGLNKEKLCHELMVGNADVFVENTDVTKQEFEKFFMPHIEKLMDELPVILENIEKGIEVGIEYGEKSFAVHSGNKVLRIKSTPIFRGDGTSFLVEMRKNILGSDDPCYIDNAYIK